MSNPTVQLDPTIQKALIDFIKSRLGLFGAWHFKKQVETCVCKPCKTILAILTGGDISEPVS